jgi:hypothetical protein
VPSLGIADCSNSHEFACFPEPDPLTACAANKTFMLIGPRTVVTRISTAAASLGAILSIQPPFSNSSYSIQFVAPWVQCLGANESVRESMDAYIGARNASLLTASGGPQAEQFAYAAFVPAFGTSVFSNISIPFDGTEVMAIDQPRLQQHPTQCNKPTLALLLRLFNR